MVTEAEVRKALRGVKDPELRLDLVVLGLIYDIRIEGAHVDVTMSLTSPACPVAPQIVADAQAAVEAVEGVESAEVELTFSPLWTPERIPSTIRSALGL
jgi:metal-sulfur cluster biosynthetic enzyme